MTTAVKSLKLNRILSKPITFILLKTPVTPNQVTFFNLFLGILSGFLFSQGRYVSCLTGAVAYQLLSILDNCDGEIARAKNLKSKFGGWLDVVVDMINDAALFAGITLGLLKNGTEGPVFFFGVLAVTGSLVHSSIVILEKIKGFGPAVFNQSSPHGSHRGNIFFKILEAVREGDISWAVIGFVILGQTPWLLWLGALYMQFIWLSALTFNFKWIFANENR